MFIGWASCGELNEVLFIGLGIGGRIGVDWGGSIVSVDLVGDVARAENVWKLCFGGDNDESDSINLEVKIKEEENNLVQGMQL